MGSQAEERCLLFSSFPLLPLPGAQLLGSHLNVNFLQTVRPLALDLALEAAISTPGSRNVTRLRSGATLATTTTTNAGMETTASSRSATGTAAPVFATSLAAWTTAATTTAATPGPALALAPLALTLTPRSATLLKSLATLVWTQRAAGMATTASTRLTSGMVATECAQ